MCCLWEESFISVGAQVKKNLEYRKVDGRNYKMHQKRLNPPPQPVLAPSVYAKDIAPGYSQEELESRGATGPMKMRHDYVRFLTTGDLYLMLDITC